jgi:hypothetical protein
MSTLKYVIVGVVSGTAGFIGGVVVGKNFARPIVDEKALEEFLKNEGPKEAAKFSILFKEAVKTLGEERDARVAAMREEEERYYLNAAKKMAPYLSKAVSV